MAVLISEDQVQAKVAELAAVVSKDYEGRTILLGRARHLAGRQGRAPGELLTWAPAAG